MALFWFGAFNLRSAGCAINDFIDQDIDKKVERTKNRPLARGALTYEEALKFIMMHLSGGLLVLFCFNWQAITYALLGFAVRYSLLFYIL